MIAPFGAPDADGAALDAAAFIEFRGRRFRSGLGMDLADGSIQIITGGKGAGKTHYLRRLQASHSRNRSVYVDEWRNEYPSTHHVLEVWGMSSSRDDCRLRWSLIWRRAIVRAAVSHLLTAQRLRSCVPESLRSALLGFEDLIDLRGASSIVAEVNRILVRAGSARTDLDGLLKAPEWDDLERYLAEALEEAPPMFFVVDGLDEEFEIAPTQWMDCQVGLLRQILSLRSHAQIGRRLHVVAGIRDVVHSDWQRSEHALRHYARPEIRHLPWDRDAISYFLHRKIERLPEEWFIRSNRTAPVERWLGVDSITNVKRKTREPVEDYLIRHTRLIPRDIIQMGNALCACIDRAVDMGDGCLSDDVVRRTVARIAKRIGDEQLAVVANHITADLMPREAIEYFFVESYVSRQAVSRLSVDEAGRAYAGAVYTKLAESLGKLREDRVTRARLLRFSDDFRREIGDIDVLSMLWRHRLLGYVRGANRLLGDAVFYTPGEDDGMSLPLEHRHYALAPVVIDAAPQLSGVGAAVRL